MSSNEPTLVDVLIVGAGPTGLAMGLGLARSGLSVRIIDRSETAAHESRAMAIQARTLELLPPDVSRKLVASGRTGVQLDMHSAGSTASMPLFVGASRITAFPFILFVSQAITESVLLEKVVDAGLQVERGVTLTGLRQRDESVECAVAGADPIHARYVVGSDGAHSVCRRLAGIPFVGATHPQTFLLADLEIDGLDRGRVHAFPNERGMMLAFPLGVPAPWRLLVMRERHSARDGVTLDELQAHVDAYTGGSPGSPGAGRSLVLHDPAWMSTFTINSRRARTFRSGRVFLAGDAAHVHSPAGAQGMNTGIQDAINLSWKLSLVCKGLAAERLLDTYGEERLSVARSVLRMTDRAFGVAVSRNPLVARLRARAPVVVAPVVLGIPFVQRLAFRVVSELALNYRRSSLSANRAPDKRIFRPRGIRVRAGDRAPWPVTKAIHARGEGESAFTLVVVGHVDAKHLQELGRIVTRWGGVVALLRLPSRQLTRRFRWRQGTIVLLVRPDHYLAWIGRASELTAVDDYLATLFLLAV